MGYIPSALPLIWNTITNKMQFSTDTVSKSYNLGDYMHYDGKFYKCNATHTAETSWTATEAAKWTQTIISNEFGSGGGGGTVTSVNGKTGAVVLNAGDILTVGGTKSIEQALDSKITLPIGVSEVNYVPKSNGAGGISWSAESVISVNTKTGVVVLKAEDIKMNNNETLEDEVTRKHTELDGAINALGTALGFTVTSTYNPTTKVYDYTFTMTP